MNRTRTQAQPVLVLVLEWAQILAATDGIDDESHRELKRMLKRIVSMLTRLIARADVVSEPSEEYNTAVEYEYDFVEQEHEEQPEPSDTTEDRIDRDSNLCPSASIRGHSFQMLCGRNEQEVTEDTRNWTVLLRSLRFLLFISSCGEPPILGRAWTNVPLPVLVDKYRMKATSHRTYSGLSELSFYTAPYVVESVLDLEQPTLPTGQAQRTFICRVGHEIA